MKMANFAVPLLLFVLTIAFAKDDKVDDCPSQGACKKIATNPQKISGVFTNCHTSEIGNDKSRSICDVVYVQNPPLGLKATATIPNADQCTATASDKATAACDSYRKSRSPYKGSYNGVPYANCYTASTPYICKDGKKEYIFCSVQAVACPDTAQPTANHGK